MPTMTAYRHGVPSWVDVSAPDVDASVGFYAAVFGWTATPATYFAVADLSNTVSRCTAAGGGVVVPGFDTPVGQMAVLHEPAGAVFAPGQFTAVDDPNDWPS